MRSAQEALEAWFQAKEKHGIPRDRPSSEMSLLEYAKCHAEPEVGSDCPSMRHLVRMLEIDVLPELKLLRSGSIGAQEVKLVEAEIQKVRDLQARLRAKIERTLRSDVDAYSLSRG